MRRYLEVALAGGDRGPIHDAIVEDIYSEAYVAAHKEELAARRGQLDLLPEVWLTGLDQLLRCTEKVDLRPHLGRIEAPALVVIAGGDTVMLPERSRALAAALGAEVEELEESGHGLILERPHWLYERCEAFLDRQAGRTPETQNTTRGGT
jgi:pimeloyl-ACP methyl ester carboxylesterase